MILAIVLSSKPSSSSVSKNSQKMLCNKLLLFLKGSGTFILLTDEARDDVNENDEDSGIFLKNITLTGLTMCLLAVARMLFQQSGIDLNRKTISDVHWQT